MSEDAPLVMFVRPLRHLVGQRAWVVHVVPVPDPDATPTFLVAYCGQAFAPRTIELLPEPTGAPCVLCLAKVPVPGTEQLPGRQRMREQ